MKNFIKMLGGIILLAIVVILIGKVGYYETHRTEKVVVMEVTEDSYKVYDYNGHHWYSIEKNKNFTLHRGEEVTVKIWNNGTDRVYIDDEIISVKGVKVKSARIEIGYYEDFGDPYKPM